jgi:DNA repair protein RecN (Recombination protein N)
VAAFADRHLRVHKRLQGGRTCATVVALESEAERREEVARMLAGVTLTDSALEHAGALISVARNTSGAAHGRRTSSARSAARRAAR